MHLEAGDLLYLISVTGILVYDLFNVVGSDGILEEESLNKLIADMDPDSSIFTVVTAKVLGTLSMSISVLFILQATLQTAIVIFGNNVRRIRPYTGRDKKIALFWSLVIGNLSIWFGSTLLLGSVRYTDPIKELVFSKQTWIVISRCVYPMLLFFRLHSCHLLYVAGDNIFGERHENH